MDQADFSGTKLFLLCEDRLLVYRRDDRPDISFPNCWDLPGGGREGDESPEACVLRELNEEFGLEFSDDRLHWKRRYASWRSGDADSVFFAAELAEAEVAAIRFGNEGQYWQMMAVLEYLQSENSIAIV
jgi:8-oxo-dGTP diphosphatase